YFPVVGRGTGAGHETHLHQAGDHARQGRDVDAGPGGNVDLALAVIVGEHRQHAPHRDAQLVAGERVLPQADHQQPAAAVDEIGKIFAEIEAPSIGHEFEIPANSRGPRFYGPPATMSKGGPGWIARAVGRIMTRSSQPMIALTTVANAVPKQGCSP